MPQIGKIAGRALGFFGSKALSPSLPTFRPSPNIRTPAFNLTSTAGGDVSLERLAAPQRFTGILEELEAVKAEVKPGFGRFTESVRAEFSRLRDRTLGNARDALTRRRVAGANFATNQLAQLDAAITERESKATAGALLQELATTTELIDASFKTQLADFNLDLEELKLSTGVSNTIITALSEQAVIDKQLAAQAIEGTGAFLSDVGGDIGTLIGGGGEDNIVRAARRLFGGGLGESVTI